MPRLIAAAVVHNLKLPIRHRLRQYRLERFLNIRSAIVGGHHHTDKQEAIRRAEGKYVAFLDSDDLWLPDKLEKQISFMDASTDWRDSSIYVPQL